MVVGEYAGDQGFSLHKLRCILRSKERKTKQPPRDHPKAAVSRDAKRFIRLCRVARSVLRGCFVFLAGADALSANLHFFSVDLSRLQIKILPSFGCDVGVRSSIARHWASSAFVTDSGHIGIYYCNRELRLT